MALCDSHSGSHWLSLPLSGILWPSLALSGSLLLANFAFTVLNWLSEPLLGSRRRCHADALSPALIFTILVNYIATTQSAETDGGTQRPPSFGFAERGARGFHEDVLHILTKTALSVTI